MEAFAVAAAVAGAVAVLLAVGSASGPVSRSRVATFARRHRLVITPDNGEAVIRYLATTRRWRAAGLAGGFLAYLAWTAPQGRIGVHALTLLAGWFVGALAAETRLASPPSGPRRALLAPRQAAAYLARPVRLALPASLGALGVVTGVGLWSGRAGTARPVLLWAVAGAAVALLAVTARRRVLRRPQPVTTADRLAADDAIRSRSLHVLTAAGATLVAYCVLGQLAAIGSDAGGGLAGALSLVGALAAPVLGLFLATRPWPAGPGVAARFHPAGGTPP